MIVTKQIEIDMVHRVPNHKSKCKNFHGHRYKIEVGVDDKVITTKGNTNEGMVIDFSDLKHLMMDLIDKNYDHSFVMYKNDIYRELFEQIKSGFVLENDEWELKGNALKIHFVEFIPTAENLAKHWFIMLGYELKQLGIQINHVRVWETPNSTALYTIKNAQEDNVVELE